jgi:hypothetical protein
MQYEYMHGSCCIIIIIIIIIINDDDDDNNKQQQQQQSYEQQQSTASKINFILDSPLSLVASDISFSLQFRSTILYFERLRGT